MVSRLSLPAVGPAYWQVSPSRSVDILPDGPYERFLQAPYRGEMGLEKVERAETVRRCRHQVPYDAAIGHGLDQG